MKKYSVWYRTEWKRAGSLLPAIFLKAVILAIGAGIVAFFCCHFLGYNNTKQLVKIGYYVEQDELTALAANYVSEMESISSWCTLLPMEKKEGQKKLSTGEITAFIVFPDRVVESILNGENEPATLYLQPNQGVESNVFCELLSSLVKMLQTAQAQIYATGDLCRLHKVENVELNSIYEEIDHMNLQIAMNREQYFKVREVSSTGTDSFTIYYGGVFLTICFLLISILVAREWKITREEQDVIAKRLGIPVLIQIVSRNLIITGMLIILFIPIMCICFLLPIAHLFHFEMNGETLIYFLLFSFVISTFIQMICCIGKTKIQKTWMLSIIGIITTYLCGCMVPAALLPDILEKGEKYLPLTYLRKAFTCVIGGDIGCFMTGVIVLLIWLAIITVMTLVLSNIQFYGINPKKQIGDKGESVLQISFRRLLSYRLFWIALISSCIFTVTISAVEKHMVNFLRSAIFTESEELRNLFDKQDGFVQFELCNSEEELKRKIVKEGLECGYVLQDELQNDIRDGKGNWSVIVYRNSESVMMPVINESLFSTLFYNITTDWYEGYIANNVCFEKIKEAMGEKNFRQEIHEYYQKRLSDDSTFHIIESTVPESTSKEEQVDQFRTKNGKNIFPSYIVYICNIMFAVLAGLYTIWNDRRLKRYLKGMIGKITLYTISMPIAIAFLADFCTIVLIKFI